MPVQRRLRPPARPSLFDPRPSTPSWPTLPPAVRQAVLPLLVHLLREHQAAVRAAREVIDE